MIFSLEKLTNVSISSKDVGGRTKSNITSTLYYRSTYFYTSALYFKRAVNRLKFSRFIIHLRITDKRFNIDVNVTNACIIYIGLKIRIIRNDIVNVTRTIVIDNDSRLNKNLKILVRDRLIILSSEIYRD